MDNSHAIKNAEAELAETTSRLGEKHIEVSYKLDKLAALLKENGRLLEAANCAAKAKAIRSHHFQQESERQEEKFGNATAPEQIVTAKAWLNKLYRAALIFMSIVLFLSVIIRPGKPSLELARGLIGSSAAAVVLQLLLFPIKSIPRILKFVIVAVGTSLIWALIGGSDIANMELPFKKLPFTIKGGN